MLLIQTFNSNNPQGDPGGSPVATALSDDSDSFEGLVYGTQHSATTEKGHETPGSASEVFRLADAMPDVDASDHDRSPVGDPVEEANASTEAQSKSAGSPAHAQPARELDQSAADEASGDTEAERTDAEEKSKQSPMSALVRGLSEATPLVIDTSAAPAKSLAVVQASLAPQTDGRVTHQGPTLTLHQISPKQDSLEASNDVAEAPGANPGTANKSGADNHVIRTITDRVSGPQNTPSTKAANVDISDAVPALTPDGTKQVSSPNSIYDTRAGAITLSTDTSAAPMLTPPLAKNSKAQSPKYAAAQNVVDASGKTTSATEREPNNTTLPRATGVLQAAPQSSFALAGTFQPGSSLGSLGHMAADDPAMLKTELTWNLHQGGVSHASTVHAVVARAELPHHLSQTIAQVFQNAPDKPIEVALRPAELGHVRLTMSATETGMTVTVSAERGETLDLMRRNIEDLGRSLQDLGFEDVSFAFEQQKRDQDQSKSTEAADPASEATGEQAIPKTPNNMMSIIRTTPAITTGIDMRL